MGLRASQVLPNIDSILDFAGLTDAASNRMVTLSSGQRMRLGFAVSTSVQHDIMLLDEWFGAGDAEFVDKARERMSGRVQGSKIVILASHNLKMLRQVCNRGLVIEDGRIVYAGGLEESIEAYKATYQTSAEYQQYKREKRTAENETLAARLEQRVWRRQVRNQRKQILAQWEKIRAEKEKIMKQKEYLAKRELVIEKKMSEMRDDKG